MGVDVPVELVTLIWTVADPAGEVAVKVVPVEFTVTLFAGVLPKDTIDPCVNPAPVIVTTVPPDAGPELGLSEAITGM